MGRKRKHKKKAQALNPVYPPGTEAGFKSAYQAYPPETDPLIKSSVGYNTDFRTTRGQRLVGKMKENFTTFFRIAEERIKRERRQTLYDLHRTNTYWDQTTRLRANYGDLVAVSTSILDIGCGSGKLIRRILRTPSKMKHLEEHAEPMRILGIDFC